MWHDQIRNFPYLNGTIAANLMKFAGHYKHSYQVSIAIIKYNLNCGVTTNLRRRIKFINTTSVVSYILCVILWFFYKVLHSVTRRHGISIYTDQWLCINNKMVLINYSIPCRNWIHFMNALLELNNLKTSSNNISKCPLEDCKMHHMY